MNIFVYLFIVFILTIFVYMVVNFLAETPKELKRIADALDRKTKAGGR